MTKISPLRRRMIEDMTCEIASNFDPTQRLDHLIDLLDESNRLVGSHLGAKNDPLIPIFQNEFNRVEDFPVIGAKPRARRCSISEGQTTEWRKSAAVTVAAIATGAHFP